MSITFFMGAGPAVKPVRHFLSPDRMEGASGMPAKFAGYPCRGELHSPPRHPAGMNDRPMGGLIASLFGETFSRMPIFAGVSQEYTPINSTQPMNGMRLFMLAAALLCGLTLAGCNDKDEGDFWVPTFRLQYIDTEGHNLLPDDVQGVEITITDEGGTVLEAVQKPEILGGWIAFSIPETFFSNSDRKAEKKRYEISVKIPSLFGPDRVERFTVGGAMAYFMHYDEATYNGQPMQRQQVQLENAFDPIRSRPTAVEVSDHGAAPTLYLIIPLQPKP